MIQLHEEPLTKAEQLVHEEALLRAKNYRVSEAELLEIVIEVDRMKLYRKFGLRSTFKYCMSFLKLSKDVAYNFIAVARKCHEVHELKEAIEEERFSVQKARKIVSVLTVENQSEWLSRAETLSKERLEKEVARVSPAAVARESFERTSEKKRSA